VTLWRLLYCKHNNGAWELQKRTAYVGVRGNAKAVKARASYDRGTYGLPGSDRRWYELVLRFEVDSESVEISGWKENHL